MESLRDSRNISSDGIVPGAAATTCVPRTRHSKTLQDILMSDKPNLSYADFHRELTKNPDSPLPKYVGSQQSQVLERRNLKEELVRYMSNLPNYLERGKTNQERALSVGVLDWRRLEKWRNSQKQMPPKHSAYSPSSSSTSLFSTDGSSTHSSRGRSCSPSRQRPQSINIKSKEGHDEDAESSSGKGHNCPPVCHVTQGSLLQSHPEKVIPGGKMPHEIEVFGGNTRVHKFQDSTATTGNRSSRLNSIFGLAPLCERKGSDLQSLSETGRKSIPDKYEVAATWKGKKKVQEVEISTKETGRSRETKLNAAVRDCSVRAKSGIITMSRDPTERTYSSFTDPASFTENDRLYVEPGEKFLERNNFGYRQHTSNRFCNQLEPNVSCVLNDTGVKSSFQALHISQQSAAKKFRTPSSSIRVEDIKISAETSHMSSFPARMLSSPSRNRHTQEKKTVADIRRNTAVEPSEELDAIKNSVSIPKARNPSPIRRLSFAMGNMIKNVGSRDNSPLRRPISKDCVSKSESDAADSSLIIGNPCSDNLPINNIRGRFSPLRRLLDPFLEPRVSNFSEQSNKQASSGVDTLKSLCKPPLDSRPRHAIEVNSKNGSSTLQALLQVSFKNGLPLFTFAIDNEKNILAATVRKSNAPGKGHHSWIYTFFAIHEVKRKSGSWLNRGGKSVSHGIFPNVMAQMKVLDSCSSPSIKQKNIDDNDDDDEVVSREFDLFAVDVESGDEYSTDFHPTNELAAIIVKLPRITIESDNKVDNSSYDWLDISHGSLGENSLLTRSTDDSGCNSQFHCSLMTLNLCTTVILPSGVHTIPSKGELSRLAQRWRSGGLCDCGGWDLGCQLRVYTDKKENKTKFDSSGVCPNKDKLQLFTQVGQDNQPVLSLARFKERIYSVEFGSSLTLLQAFAVSISFIDCRRPPDLPEPSNVPEKVTAEVGVFEVPIRSNTLNPAEVPGHYVSYSPHSPVGRV